MFIGCFYAKVNQKIQCFVYEKCFPRNTFYPFVYFQALDTFFPKQKASKEIYYHVKEYI